jgi:hypothetical protein
VTLSHAIAWGNTGGDLVNVVCGNVSWSVTGSPDCSSVNDNLASDPMLDGAYRLQTGSPALDHGPDPALYTGTPCTDAAGDLRLRDHDGDGLARLDPGAYEETNGALVPGAVGNLRWSAADTLDWDATAGAVEYHVYRDSLASLGYGIVATCRDDLDGLRTDTQLVDPELPGSGQVFIYWISAEDGATNEGTLGAGSCAERSNFAACP